MIVRAFIDTHFKFKLEPFFTIIYQIFDYTEIIYVQREHNKMWRDEKKSYPSSTVFVLKPIL